MIRARVVPTIILFGCMLVPIQIELDDATVESLQNQILDEIHKNDKIKAVIIDVSMLDIIDSYMSYTLSETAAMARLMGCRTIVCGIRPAVALTLAQMGVPLSEGIEVARDLEHALLLVGAPFLRG